MVGLFAGERLVLLRLHQEVIDFARRSVKGHCLLDGSRLHRTPLTRGMLAGGRKRVVTNSCGGLAFDFARSKCVRLSVDSGRQTAATVKPKNLRESHRGSTFSLANCASAVIWPKHASAVE